ncbi:pogo transposable [Alternaria alternata]|nr:pogo transposable [Alternaria alternata]
MAMAKAMVGFSCADVLTLRVADKAKVEAKQLSQSIHSLQVSNELLHDQNAGLQQELNARSKQKLTSKTLDLRLRLLHPFLLRAVATAVSSFWLFHTGGVARPAHRHGNGPRKTEQPANRITR